MGFLQDVFSGAPQAGAAAKDQALMNQYGTQADQYLNTAYGTGQANLGNAIGAYTPLQTLGNQYNQAGNLFLGALGAGGPQGTADAQAAFTNAPGYAQGLKASLDAIQQQQAAGGMGYSGATDMDRMTFAQNLQNQQYNNWLNNLQNAGKTGVGLVGQAAAGQAAGYGALANLGTQYGQDLTGVSGNVISGDTSANALQAQGQAAGAKNLLGAGLSLASLAAGGIPGGVGGGGGNFLSGLFGGNQPSTGPTFGGYGGGTPGSGMMGGIRYPAL